MGAHGPRLALRLLPGLLLALASSLDAQERSIRIREFDAQIEVSEEGDLEVTERLTLGFTGSWNGIVRDLSLQHNTAEGRRRKLDLDVLSVTDAEGKELRVEEEDEGNGWSERLRIWVPGATDADRQVVLRYRVEGAIRFYFADSGEGGESGEFDELYWNVTGNEWDMPIDRARARVALPGGVTPHRWAVYTGPAGATASDAELQVIPGGVIATTTRELAPFEGMTIGIGWPAGHIATRPSASGRTARETLRHWPAVLPFIVFALALGAWRRRGRDPEAQAIVVQYEPPDGLSPAELGTLVDHKAQMRDITATLVDLAVRGYVLIEERTEKKLLGLMTDTEFVFHSRRPRTEWTALAPHEALYLEGIFRHATLSAAPVAAGHGDGHDPVGTGESVRLSQLTNKFHSSLPGIRNAIYDSLVRRGYYLSRPDRVKALWIVAAAAAAGAGIFGAGFASDQLAEWISAPALIGAGVASAVILLGFGLVMPARTTAGARARERVLGFREFLSRVETDRYRRMITSPEMFERYLPHAMALGEEDRWAKAFESIVQEPPGWYSGSRTGRFHATHFSSRMSTLSTAASSTMSSSPRSSGSGGGGSSGGGSGGGGGSGF